MDLIHIMSLLISQEGKERGNFVEKDFSTLRAQSNIAAEVVEFAEELEVRTRHANMTALPFMAVELLYGHKV
jgi:hypothetical protein